MSDAMNRSVWKSSRRARARIWLASLILFGSLGAAQAQLLPNSPGSTAPTPAGSAIIGKVGIDQTTPGTSNGVAVTALPVTAATATNQILALAQALTAAPTFVNLFGGTFQTTPPAPANGQISALQVDSAGTLKVVERGSADPLTGIPPVVTPAAGATSLLGKAAAGNLYSYSATSLSATAGFVAVLNLAAVPTSGATITPLECRILPASGSYEKSYNPGPGPNFSVGIVVVVSTSCGTYTPGGASFLEVLAR